MLLLKNRRGMDTRPSVDSRRPRVRGGRAREKHAQPLDASSTRPKGNEIYLGPLAPLHAPLLLLLLPLRVPDPLLDVVRVDLEVLLLVEALHDLLRA